MPPGQSSTMHTVASWASWAHNLNDQWGLSPYYNAFVCVSAEVWTSGEDALHHEAPRMGSGARSASIRLIAHALHIDTLLSLQLVPSAGVPLCNRLLLSCLQLPSQAVRVVMSSYSQETSISALNAGNRDGRHPWQLQPC